MACCVLTMFRCLCMNVNASSCKQQREHYLILTLIQEDEEDRLMSVQCNETLTGIVEILKLQDVVLFFFFYLSVYLSTNLCTSIYYISLYLSNYLPAYLSTIYLISNPRNDLRMLKLILRAVNTCKGRVVGASA